MPQDLIATLRATDEEISPLYRRDAADALEAQAAEIARQQQVITDVNARCDHLGMRLGEVIKERDGLRADAERLAYVYTGPTTTSNALIELEIRLINGETPTIEEVRAAIDAARAAREST